MKTVTSLHKMVSTRNNSFLRSFLVLAVCVLLSVNVGWGKTTNTLQQVLHLQVSNGTNTDETIVYFNDNASDGCDVYDSPKMINANSVIPKIYTSVSDEELAINGMNSYTSGTALAVGFRPGKSNTFTMKASEISNFDANTKIILKDNYLSTEQELTVGTPYSFVSDATPTDTRFTLIFKIVPLTANYFRSKTTGNWSNTATWETSSDGNTNWITAISVPDASATAITILSGHTVTIDENTAITSLTINPEAKLTLNSGKTLSATTFNINSDTTGTGTFVDMNPSGGITVAGKANEQQYLAFNWSYSF